MKDTRYNREKNVPRMSVSGEVDARFSAFDAADVELVKNAQAGNEDALSDCTTFTLADETPKVAHTRPIEFLFLDTKYSVNTWTDFVIEIARLVRQGVRGDLLDEVRPSDIAFTGRLCISSSPDGMIAPKKIDDALWIETNFCAKQLVDFAKWLTWWCDVEQKKVIVCFHKKNIEGNKPCQKSRDTRKPPHALTSLPGEVRSFLMSHFPKGLNLSPTGFQLLKTQVPIDFLSCINAGNLKQCFIPFGDDIWLLPEMIATPETIEKIRTRLLEVLLEYPSCAVSILLEEFAQDMKNVCDNISGLSIFLRACILPQEIDIIGHEQKMQCVYKCNLPEDAINEKIAQAVQSILAEAGDATSEEELLARLPYLNVGILTDVCEKHLQDAIFLEQEGVRYWKLLEHFWLPEDFSEQLLAIVQRLEQAYAMATLAQLKQELKEVYGANFQEEYALTGDDIFRQVIKASWRGDSHIWKKGSLFVAGEKEVSSTENSSVLNAFLLQHHGVFHEDDFVSFAKNVRGLKSPTAILTSVLLLPSCIRLSERLWISPDDFEDAHALSDTDWQEIEKQMSTLLGNKAFLPVSELSQAFYDALPPLVIGETTYYWNAYLLSSVAQFRQDILRIENTTVAPYSITGLFVPRNADIDERDDNGVIDYCLKHWPRQNGAHYSADDAFDFLKAHQIRLRKSKLLLAHLEGWLKEHSHV